MATRNQTDFKGQKLDHGCGCACGCRRVERARELNAEAVKFYWMEPQRPQTPKQPPSSSSGTQLELW